MKISEITNKNLIRIIWINRIKFLFTLVVTTFFFPIYHITIVYDHWFLFLFYEKIISSYQNVIYSISYQLSFFGALYILFILYLLIVKYDYFFFEIMPFLLIPTILLVDTQTGQALASGGVLSYDLGFFILLISIFISALLDFITFESLNIKSSLESAISKSSDFHMIDVHWSILLVFLLLDIRTFKSLNIKSSLDSAVSESADFHITDTHWSVLLEMVSLILILFLPMASTDFLASSTNYISTMSYYEALALSQYNSFSLNSVNYLGIPYTISGSLTFHIFLELVLLVVVILSLLPIKNSTWKNTLVLLDICTITIYIFMSSIPITSYYNFILSSLLFLPVILFYFSIYDKHFQRDAYSLVFIILSLAVILFFGQYLFPVSIREFSCSSSGFRGCLTSFRPSLIIFNIPLILAKIVSIKTTNSTNVDSSINKTPELTKTSINETV